MGVVEEDTVVPAQEITVWIGCLIDCTNIVTLMTDFFLIIWLIDVVIDWLIDWLIDCVGGWGCGWGYRGPSPGDLRLDRPAGRHTGTDYRLGLYLPDTDLAEYPANKSGY